MKSWAADYIAAQHRALDTVPLEAIDRMIETVRQAWLADKNIFVIGNGGNAASASHFATDLGKGASDVAKKRFRVFTLGDNTAWLTALGNDYSYDDVFVRQLENFAGPGDVVITGSVSGNSPNLVKAFDWAKQKGLHTIALVGAKKGKLAEVSEQTIVIGDTHYGRVEDVQMNLLHMLAYAFMEPSAAKTEKTSAPKFSGSVEFAKTFAPRSNISHVLFDFDGTLSLVREGWVEVMVPMFVEYLPRLAGETEADLAKLATDDIMRLNGKQTIYQMIQLAERITERGGTPREPLWYKHEYLRRLDGRISRRLEGLRNGSIKPDELLVHKTRALLEELKQRGLSLYLASGTDEPFVKKEAELLDVTRYFGPHVYGALDDYKQFSKKMVIERILRENKIQGSQLLSFGDGYVEIQNTKEAGGLAVAVASDEAHNGSGRVDQWKRDRLVGVGADVVIPDYRDAAPLLKLILGR